MVEKKEKKANGKHKLLRYLLLVYTQDNVTKILLGTVRKSEVLEIFTTCGVLLQSLQLPQEGFNTVPSE